MIFLPAELNEWILDVPNEDGTLKFELKEGAPESIKKQFDEFLSDLDRDDEPIF